MPLPLSRPFLVSPETFPCPFLRLAAGARTRSPENTAASCASISPTTTGASSHPRHGAARHGGAATTGVRAHQQPHRLGLWLRDPLHPRPCAAVLRGMVFRFARIGRMGYSWLGLALGRSEVGVREMLEDFHGLYRDEHRACCPPGAPGGVGDAADFRRFGDDGGNGVDTGSIPVDGIIIRKPEARSPKPEARSPKPEARSPKPEARSPKPEARSPKPEARSPKPEARSPKPEARSPKPEARSPKPEARSPKPEARSPKPEACDCARAFRIRAAPAIARAVIRPAAPCAVRPGRAGLLRRGRLAARGRGRDPFGKHER